jgi:hypothetical protein
VLWCNSRGIPWVGSGGKWGMQDYYIKMMDQGYKINPAAVYFIEVSLPVPMLVVRSVC